MVQCNFSSLGSYAVRIYLQDDSHPAWFGTYDSFTIQVIDGVKGSTCSAGSQGIGEEPVSQALSGGAFQGTPSPSISPIINALNWLTGGNQNVKLLIGSIIVLSVMVWIGLATQMVTLAILAGLITFIILTVMTIFPVWMLVFTFILLALAGFVVMQLKAGG